MQQEVTMLAPIKQEEIALIARDVHRLQDARGQTVTCLQGAVWITQERDRRDIVLAAGQSFVLDRPGVTVLFAFQDAAVSIVSPWQIPDTTSVPVHARPERARA
jgi:hypothetical protein